MSEAKTGGSHLVPALALLESPPPSLTPQQVAKIAAAEFGQAGTIAPLEGERDQNFALSAHSGRFVVKVSNAQDSEEVLAMQLAAMRHVAEVAPDLPVMAPVTSLDGRDWVAGQGVDGKTYLVRLFRESPGRHLEARSMSLEAVAALGGDCARLGKALRGFFHPAAGRELAWDLRRVPQLRPLLELIPEPDRRAMVARAIDDFEQLALPRLGGLRAQVIHNDLCLSNVLFGDDQRLSAILDFGDLIHAPLICDLVASAEHLLQRDDGLLSLRTLVDAYSAVTPLEDAEAELFPDLLRARWAALALISSFRRERYPATARYVSSWQVGVWEMFQTVDDWGPRRWRAQMARAAGLPSPAAAGDPPCIPELAAKRQRLLGTALSPLFYRSPLHLVRGKGVFLFDPAGRRYLDCYNNVPIVGHGHPRVVAAIARQARLLNTNVRYLHQLPLDLAERLVETMPAGLDTVMFANSGSEVNDLAWRLARSFTGGSGAVVSSHAYHGSTWVTAGLSPEEWRGEEMAGQVALIPAPDGYFGEHRREVSGWAVRYAAELDRAIEELASRGLAPGALFIDTGWSSEGILAPPPEYLVELCRRWRAAGGVVVADEVQMGFGRSGSELWGFQLHGIVPDLVTMGKPMGNGHPVAALVARRELVERFAQTSSWFSTFGGNPVAAAAALAVLEILEEDRLVAHAGSMSGRLRAGLDRLADRYPTIGDVRQTGLLVGVELVQDRRTRQPHPAGPVVEGLRDRGVLIGSTGPRGNVLKIRPPLVIAEEEVDLLLDALDSTLASLA
jgi:4-aminobutyrate aminotransferase-like enzyme/Ser/Thr protein kinase RdoA (MazF antagonist)